MTQSYLLFLLYLVNSSNSDWMNIYYKASYELQLNSPYGSTLIFLMFISDENLACTKSNIPY